MTDNELRKKSLQVATALNEHNVATVEKIALAYIMGYSEAKKEVLKKLETLGFNKEIL